MQNRQILHFDSLSSTQDEARKQLQLLVQGNDNRNETKRNPNVGDDIDISKEENKYNHIAITTAVQTNGRGTSGRKWIGEKGNTFVTIAVPSSDLFERGNVPITLLPLQVGVIIAQRIHDIIKSSNSSNSSSVNVKWPNDVLVNGKKIAGVLIESEQVTMRGGVNENYFLIGIGINYKFAPKIDQEVDSPERGRESTCICDFIDASSFAGANANDDENSIIVQKAKELGVAIANDVWEWVEMQSTWDGAAEAVVRNFEHWAEFGQELVLRDSPGNDIVIPLNIEYDGRLRVKNKFGVERLLCADYLL